LTLHYHLSHCVVVVGVIHMWSHLQPLGVADANVLNALFNHVRRARVVEKRALTKEELTSVASKFQMADAAAAEKVCFSFPCELSKRG
jgi:hypothetical protein